ncbi:MAG: glycosyltransferase family 2 protein, partial [Firmicutes bacterium]|nr:glycosyltransferase family 2 protein [Bacillota bacterium]
MGDTPNIQVSFSEKSYKDGFLTIRGTVSCREAEIDKIFLYAMVGDKKLPLDCGIEIEFKNDPGSSNRIKTIKFYHISSLGTRRRIHLYLSYMIGVDQYTRPVGSVKRSIVESAKIYSKLLTKEKMQKAFKLASSGRVKDLIRYLLAASTPQLTGFESLRVASYKRVSPMLISGETEGAGKESINAHQGYLQAAYEEVRQALEKPVDVVIPVYNGKHFFPKLFESIQKTNLPYRLIVVDDCSPDPETYPALESYIKDFPNALLLKNESNKGFVTTVNRGLKETKGHAVIMNTDIELPEGWLERLIRPRVVDE